MTSEDGSESEAKYPIFPYYDKDNPAFIPNKFISRALCHHTCEILYQTLLKFVVTPSGTSAKAPETPPSTPRYGT